MSPLRHKEVPRARFHRELLLGAFVGGAMLLITGFYAATFRYQDVFSDMRDDLPRWSALSEGLIVRTKPLQTTLLDVKDKVLFVSKAHQTQQAAVATLKAKIESGTAASASATAETP